MQINFNKIDPIFFFSFREEGGRYYIQIMGEGDFEASFHEWIKQRKRKQAFNRKYEQIDEWENKSKKVSRILSSRKYIKPALEYPEYENEILLLSLSGSSHVNGDSISLRDNRNGTKQIICNKNPTSCWIDREGKIGSYSKGGPSVIQFLQWYNPALSCKQATDIIKGIL